MKQLPKQFAHTAQHPPYSTALLLKRSAPGEGSASQLDETRQLARRTPLLLMHTVGIARRHPLHCNAKQMLRMDTRYLVRVTETPNGILSAGRRGKSDVLESTGLSTKNIVMTTNSCFMISNGKITHKELNISRLFPVHRSMSLFQMDVFTEEQNSQERAADLYNSAQLLNQSLLREKVFEISNKGRFGLSCQSSGARSSPFPIRFDSVAHTGRVGVARV